MLGKGLPPMWVRWLPQPLGRSHLSPCAWRCRCDASPSSRFVARMLFQNWSKEKEEKNVLIYEFTIQFINGSFLNDVTQFWTIFDPPPLIVTLFISEAVVLLSQNRWPPKTVIYLWTTPNIDQRFSTFFVHNTLFNFKWTFGTTLT